MMAAIGIVLKQSVKVFHNFRENFLLPESTQEYINRRSRITCWSMLTRGCLLRGKSFRGISTYSKKEGRLFRSIAYLGLRSLQEKDSSSQVGSPRSRISWASLEIARGCLRQFWWAPPTRAAWAGKWRSTEPFGRWIWLMLRTFWHRGLSFRWWGGG